MHGDWRAKLAVIFVVSLALSGCIMGSRGGGAEKPRVYVTPCNVVAKGVQIRVRGDTLTAEAIKPQMESIFVDDFTSPSASTIKDTYKLACYWGQRVGQRRDYYYCDGQYKAPELDDKRVINRWLLKSFTVGFSVDEHNVGTWVDASGKIHEEGSFYYMSVREVTTQCWVD